MVSASTAAPTVKTKTVDRTVAVGPAAIVKKTKFVSMAHVLLKVNNVMMVTTSTPQSFMVVELRGWRPEAGGLRQNNRNFGYR